MKKKWLVSAGLLAVAGISLMLRRGRTIPKGAQAVQNFNKEKYLGKWYEIARLDFRYERNLDNTTAVYSLNSDGSIQVVNSGYHVKNKNRKEAIGRARFVGSEKEAKLEVSFFGPFYSGYNVIAIDDDYKYALVAGKNLEYLWLLSREKTMPETVKDKYISIAQSAGYNTSDLIWVKQDR